MFESRFKSYGDAHPVEYSVDTESKLDGLTPYGSNTIEISPSNPLLTLDYGTEVAGFPFFDVASLSGPTQVEVKYAEQYPALANPNSDGPWTYSNGLANAFRVETFNLTQSGRSQSFFIQGGQRWETVRLLTDTTITFNSVGMNASSSHIGATEVSGKFSSSDPIYNEIWNLGARVVQAACVDAGNAVSTWKLTPEGVLINGQQTAQSLKGTIFGNYTLHFRTKIVRGGTGWTVASSWQPYGAKFYLTSNYPSHNTFVNTNRTLLPPNTLIFGYPWSIVNQTTLTTGWDQYFDAGIDVLEDTWYTISTSITRNGYNISINGRTVAFVPIDEAALLAAGGYFGSGSPFDGTFGFGPFQDQAALVTDVEVVAANGTTIYENDMKSESILAEYNIAPLDANVCLDGAKRDRLIWAGDFYHTGRVIASSTARFDYTLGTIERSFGWQLQAGPYKGFVPISANMGARPEYKEVQINNYGGLIDYQDLFLASVGNYFRSTGNIAALRPYWQQIKELVKARLAFIDPTSGLIADSPEVSMASYFLGPANGSANTGLFAYVLRTLGPLAAALDDTETEELYSGTSTKLNEAINKELWNPSLGIYSLSTDAPSNYSLTGIAWTILSGAANNTQAASMIAKIPELRLGVGYKTNSGDPDDDTTQLAPNICGFLLEALFYAHLHLGVESLIVARTLLEDFWSKMVTQNKYYSGASWEYLYRDGSPGIDLFTSLAHPWGAAPTYVLPEYVLGITATSPGYKTWQFAPILEGLSLTEASGTVVTPYGPINARWRIVSGGKEAIIEAKVPEGTSATLVLPAESRGGTSGSKSSNKLGKSIALAGNKAIRVSLSK